MCRTTRSWPVRPPACCGCARRPRAYVGPENPEVAVSRVSPSMAVALLALFVALGGTGYAAARINGRSITDRSISGAKLKRNTLTGRQIDESRLGRVPSAADSDFLNGRPARAYLLADGGVAASARNALLLDGASASAFLPVGGKAADADRLDGLDSSAFVPVGKVQGAVVLTVGADQTLLA